MTHPLNTAGCCDGRGNVHSGDPDGYSHHVAPCLAPDCPAWQTNEWVADDPPRIDRPRDTERNAA